MRFQANRDVLSEAVSFTVKLLPQRTTLPILSGILITTTDAGISLSAFDYEVSAQTEISANVEEPGTILVSGRLLAEIASKLPNAPVTFATEDNRIVVSCGTANFTLLSMPVEEYPTLPQISGESGVVPADGTSCPCERKGSLGHYPPKSHSTRACLPRRESRPSERPAASAPAKPSNFCTAT